MRSDRVLTLGALHADTRRVDSAISRELSARLARLGVIERVVVGSASQPSAEPRSTTGSTTGSLVGSTLDVATLNLAEDSREQFLGDPLDPITYALAADDAQGAILDLTSAPRALWSVSSGSQGRVSPDIDHLITRVERSFEPLLRFKGAQAKLGGLLLGLFGRRGNPLDQLRTADDLRGRGAAESVAPLREALSMSPTGEVDEGGVSLVRPLTFILSSTQLVECTQHIFSGESIAIYREAGWSARALCFDWTLGSPHTSQRSSSGHMSGLGDLTPLISQMTRAMLRLKVSDPSALERLGSLHQLGAHPLSVIGLQDLISAALLVHQRGQEGSIYWARGDRLTWSSLAQLSAYLVDELTDLETSPRALKRLERDEPPERLSAQLSAWLRSLTQSAARGAAHGAQAPSPAHQLIAELTHIAAKLRGGGPPAELAAQLKPLPAGFNWTPVHTSLEELLSELLG